jgi:alkanesulfonate monooxygenase SsuD/methylene tetrahydromethanopterin reductase-like flavin-dependent oxidoreductase (luciferase family)
VEFGFCYISDYHPELHGDYAAWYERLLSEWVLEDQLGFDAIWIAEHRYPGYGFSSTPVIAQSIADRTRRIRVGTAVSLLSQRHPVLTAEDWAAVDLLSGGRLNFGIGRGIYAYDFEVVGVPSGESRERFDEAWEVIRRLWTEESVSHEGRFWSFPAHSLGPRPLQQPTPPVFVGCVASPESYEWAGRNGCHVIVAPFLLDSTERQREYLDLYRATLERSGYDPGKFKVLANYHLALVKHEADLAGADQYFYNYLAFVQRTSRSRKLDSTEYAHYRPGEGMYQDIAEMRRSRTIIGTPEQCVERMAALSEACGGLSGWMFHLNYGGIPQERVVEALHLLKDEVLPAFRPPAVATRSA